METRGFAKMRATILGVPMIGTYKDYSSLGSILGNYPLFWETTISPFCVRDCTLLGLSRGSPIFAGTSMTCRFVTASSWWHYQLGISRTSAVWTHDMKGFVTNSSCILSLFLPGLCALQRFASHPFCMRVSGTSIL